MNASEAGGGAPRPSPGRRGSTSGTIWGGALGGVLLTWAVLMVLAPDLGSVVAVFGSPLLAFFVILRLLTAPSGVAAPSLGRTLSELCADPALRARVLARSGNVCADCGSTAPLTLHAVLPIGRAPTALDRRFAALCLDCLRIRRGSAATEPQTPA